MCVMYLWTPLYVWMSESLLQVLEWAVWFSAGSESLSHSRTHTLWSAVVYSSSSMQHYI
jgi:hypothetical protein